MAVSDDARPVGGELLEAAGSVEADSAIRLARDWGLLPREGEASAVRLGGGVSSNVFLVEQSGSRVVIKEALPRFRVPQEWRVSPERSRVEARFSEWALDRLTEGRVARILRADPERAVLAIEAAPSGWSSWKSRLLDSMAAPGLFGRAGRLLAQIHRLSLRDSAARAAFANADLFQAQRLEPYFEAAARRVGQDARLLRRMAGWLAEGGSCVIHGDYSPKNLLTDGERFILIDHEVATWGRPVFDVGFLLSHLLLKSLGRPRAGPRLVGGASRFLEAYGTGMRLAEEERASLPRLVGALLLARIHGKSRVEYLDERQRREASRAGSLLLSGGGTMSEALGDWPL